MINVNPSPFSHKSFKLTSMEMTFLRLLSDYMTFGAGLRNPDRQTFVMDAWHLYSTPELDALADEFFGGREYSGDKANRYLRQLSSKYVITLAYNKNCYGEKPITINWKDERVQAAVPEYVKEHTY